MAGLLDGVRRGRGDDDSAPDRAETEYHGGAPAALLPAHGQREGDAAPAGIGDLLRGATGLLGADRDALPRDGRKHLRDPARRVGSHLPAEV